MAALPITFTMIDPQTAPGEYMSSQDPSPYVKLADPTRALSMMQNPEEHMIDKGKIRIIYEYPFTHPWIFEETSPHEGFFTRADLVKVISERYKRMYTEEEASTKVSIGRAPGLLNRNRTNGKYGIWGHDIGDLDLHTITYDPQKDLYELGIDS